MPMKKKASPKWHRLNKKKVCTSRRSDKSCIPTSECEAIWVSNNGGWWAIQAASNEHKLIILCNWLCSIYCGVLQRLSSPDGLRTATTETAEQACSGVFFSLSPFWFLGDSYCRVCAFVAQMLKMKSFLQNPFRVLILLFLCSIYFRISIKF